MQHYVVCPSPDPMRFSACVLAVGPSAPLDEMDMIVHELQSRGVVGKVVFDILVANASRIRRFFCGNFDGTDFKPFKFELIEGDDAMREHSAALLAERLPSLDMVMMSRAQRFAITHGMVI